MSDDPCSVYRESLNLPAPGDIIDALLGHAVYNFNMSGAGVLTDVSQIPEFLNDCDQHQVIHLAQFSDCLTVVSMLVKQPTQDVRARFLELREELDGLFVESQVSDVSFEELFFSGKEESGGEGASEEGAQD